MGDLVRSAQLVVSMALLLSGGGKIIEFTRFRRGVEEWGLVPQRWIPSIAAALAGVELLLGGLLLFQVTPRLVSTLAVLLFLVFALAAILALRSRRLVDCHCFDLVTSEKLGVTTLLRLTFLIGVATFSAVASDGRGSVDPSNPIGAALLALGVLLLMLQLGSLSNLLQAFRAPAVPSHDGNRVSLKTAPIGFASDAKGE